MPSLQPGEALGPYQVINQIGKGGMAVVYKAFHPATNRYVALKVLPEQLIEQTQFIDRFRQEAQTIANLQHPHILPVFDYGESNSKMYMVMRYLETGTLQDRMKARTLTLKEINRFFEQLADALGYAHQQNVVHRDLKPSNVLVDAQDNLFLTDFGIAKILERQTQMTADGALMGTPDYMSPEQARGMRVDQRSDIYSLGIILYEMVTGRVPFEAETPLAVILKHINEPLPPPTQLQPSLSPAIELVLLKALAKNPDERFSSCAHFLDAWRHALNSGASLGTPSPTPSNVGMTNSHAGMVSGHTPTPLPIPSKLPPLPEPPAPPTTPNNLNMGLVFGCVGLAVVMVCLLVIVGGGALAMLGPQLSFGAATATPHIQLVEPTPQPERTTRPRDTREPPPPTPAEPTPANPTKVRPTQPPPPTPQPLPSPFNVSDNVGESEIPQLMVDETGTAHVVWLDNTLNPDGGLLYRARTAAGVWSEVLALTESSQTLIRSSVRWLRDPAGQWCVVWGAGLGWFQRCLQAGQWAETTSLRTDVSWADEPNFAYAPDGTLKVAWVNFDVIYFDNVQVNDGLNTVDTLKMVLDAKGNPHSFWTESVGDDYVLKTRTSPDGGQTWGPVEPLSTPDDHPWLGTPLEVAADAQGDVHVVWVTSTFGPNGGAAHYRRWTAQTGWGPAVPLDGGQPTTEMSLVTDATGHAYLAATGLVHAPNGMEQNGVFYFAQNAPGRWQPAQMVAVDFGSASFSRYPSLFVAAGTLHLVWQAPGVPPEIVYAALDQ